MIDVTNPEHLKALNHACVCALASNDPDYCEKLSDMTKGPLRSACVALSDPAQAAEVIRQLVERAGVAAYQHDPGDAIRYPCVLVSVAPPEMLLEFWDSYTVEPHTWASVADTQAPSVIARLLALPPNAGAEAVLAALRGEG